jgi:hypothetical protein
MIIAGPVRTVPVGMTRIVAVSEVERLSTT